MTLREKLKVPPCLCRILAINPRRRRLLTNGEIAARAGLSRDTVARLTQMTDWARVTVATIDKFAKGTGVSPLSTERPKRLLRRLSGRFLDRASPEQKRMVARVVEKLRGHPSTYRY